jgi:hypothetical protein
LPCQIHKMIVVLREQQDQNCAASPHPKTSWPARFTRSDLPRQINKIRVAPPAPASIRSDQGCPARSTRSEFPCQINKNTWPIYSVQVN